jgi:hypothetical protein
MRALKPLARMARPTCNRGDSITFSHGPASLKRPRISGRKPTGQNSLCTSRVSVLGRSIRLTAPLRTTAFCAFPPMAGQNGRSIGHSGYGRESSAFGRNGSEAVVDRAKMITTKSYSSTRGYLPRERPHRRDPTSQRHSGHALVIVSRSTIWNAFRPPTFKGMTLGEMRPGGACAGLRILFKSVGR